MYQLPKLKMKTFSCNVAKDPLRWTEDAYGSKGSTDELLTLSSADYGTFCFSAAQALPAKPEKHISIISRAIQNYHIAQWNLT